MNTETDSPTIYEPPLISGEESRDYAKQLGDQVLSAHDEILEALNRGNIPEKDIPRLIRLIQKDGLFKGTSSNNSVLMSLPHRHREVLIYTHARNGIDGKRVNAYLTSVGGFIAAAARKGKNALGESAGKLAGE